MNDFLRSRFEIFFHTYKRPKGFFLKRNRGIFKRKCFGLRLRNTEGFLIIVVGLLIKIGGLSSNDTGSASEGENNLEGFENGTMASLS